MTTAFFDADTTDTTTALADLDTVDLTHTRLADVDSRDLVALAQLGDTTAFEHIYDRYLGPVYKFVLFRVNNKTVAEDITSDVFVQVLRRLRSYEDRGQDLGAWLMTIARNKVVDHYRSSRHRRELLASDVLTGTSQRIDFDHPVDTARASDPEAATLDQAVADTLWAAVAELRPEQQEAVVLRFLFGLSVAETAAAMGKREGAIKALVYRAVNRLRTILGGRP